MIRRKFQIKLFQRGGGYIFHILCDTISIESQGKFAKLQEILNLKYPTQIQIHELSIQEFYNTRRWKGNYVANLILKFGEVLPNEVEKALCLDLDMLVRMDLRELFVLPLKDKIIAVAESLHLHATGFNSGFVLFNVKEWKKAHLQAKSIEFLQSNKPELPDQDTLNAMIPKKKRLLLPVTYNFYPHYKNPILGVFQNESESPRFWVTRKEYESLKNHAKIVHFLECAKP